MSAVRRIGFAYNPTIEAAIELRERAAGWVETRGLEHWASAAADVDQVRDRLADTDVLVVLGGDGTFLRAAQAVIAVDVPILGINVGKVGFLSKVEAQGLERVLGQLAAGEYSLENRMALECRIQPGAAGANVAASGEDTAAGGNVAASGEDTAAGGNVAASGDPAEAEGRSLVALNDLVIARGALARVVRLATSIDASHLATFTADGLVVASPTGSTGYSFSAGGPILDPTARNILVTPIAGYLSAIRSIVVRPSAVVRCRVLDAHEALVSVDGHEDIPVAVGDTIEVRSIGRPVRFVEPAGSMPFWDLVRQKVELLPS